MQAKRKATITRNLISNVEIEQPVQKERPSSLSKQIERDTEVFFGARINKNGRPKKNALSVRS